MQLGHNAAFRECEKGSLDKTVAGQAQWNTGSQERKGSLQWLLFPADYTALPQPLLVSERSDETD